MYELLLIECALIWQQRLPNQCLDGWIIALPLSKGLTTGANLYSQDKSSEVGTARSHNPCEYQIMVSGMAGRRYPSGNVCVAKRVPQPVESVIFFTRRPIASTFISRINLLVTMLWQPGGARCTVYFNVLLYRYIRLHFMSCTTFTSMSHDASKT